MNDDIARARLARVPASLRASMMAQRAELPPGAITAVARFHDILAQRNEEPDLPSRGSFQAACRTESALGLLLRVLERHAPETCLAEGRDLRREWYRHRSGAGGRPRAAAETGNTAREVRNWPQAWLALLPGLRAAPIRESSLDRHIASINRCADMVPGLRCPPRLGWLFGWELAEALAEAGVSARSAANYIGALVSLGRHGGLDAEALDGLRAIQTNLQRKGRRQPKQKASRLEALYEAGGYKEILRVVRRKLDNADAQPGWRAEAQVARATAAVLAVAVNMPARTGDVASWTFGDQLLREPWGEWHLRWRQEKTGVWLDAGVLWPEVAQVLDLHLLGGRPGRHAQRRYDALRGCNWLRFEAEGYDRRWPSEKVREAIGVPLHDLRTLAADYLRLHDPAKAPGVVSALLGHSTEAAGEAYRALCVETAAQRSWREIRAAHAAG